MTVEEAEAKTEEAHPFYETATPEQWVAALREWGESHLRNGVPLSD